MSKTNTNIKIRQVASIEGSDSGAPQAIQLVKPGVWDTVQYGRVEITESDLDEMVLHFQEDIRAHSTEEGIPINYDHGKQEAAAWIKDVENKGNGEGIWSTVVDWTTEGAQKVMDSVYKFISPEVDPVHLDMASGKLIPNVLVGAALTNYPLFKDLQAIKASENETNIIYIAMPKKSVNAEELMPADPSLEEQIDAVQDAFYEWELNPFKMCGSYVCETRDAMAGQGSYLIVCADTDYDGLYMTYQVNFTKTDTGYEFESPFQVDVQYVKMEAGEKTTKGKKLPKLDKTTKEPLQATETNNVKQMKTNNTETMKEEVVKEQVEAAEVQKEVSMEAAELAELKIAAAEGKAALLKIRRMEAAETTKAWLFNEKDGGKFPTTSHDALTDFYLGLNEKQVEAFEGIVEAMPAAKALFATEGDEGTEKNDAEADSLVAATEAIVAREKEAGKVVRFSDALKIAARENPELAKSLAPKVMKAN